MQLDSHVIREMGDGKVVTWCGEVFLPEGEWELGDGGLCWRCIKRQNEVQEWKVLSEVLEAGAAWEEDPNDGPRRARLRAAIEQLGDWMDPG